MDLSSTIDTLWLLLCACLVLLMQAGFLCLESGLTRSKNAINVALKNAVDLLVAFSLFWLVGYGIMFGGFHQDIGSTFAPDFSQVKASDAAFFFFQATFCATAVTITSGAIAERSRFKAYILLAIFLSALIYPIFCQWIWGESRDLQNGWLTERGFVDFAGSTTVHSVGGWAALAAIIIIGPRIGRFSADNKVASIPSSNLPLAMLGILFFAIGWIGFNGGSALAFNETVPFIIINTLIAGSLAGISAGLMSPFIASDKKHGEHALNGILAGLVAICASCFAVSTFEAAVIGVFAGIVFLFANELMLRHQLDDPINAVAVHLAGGIWGTLALGLFGDLEIIGTGLSRVEQIYAQCVGIVACGAFVFSTIVILLWITNKISPLRVSSEAEEQGLNVSEHGATTELADLLNGMDYQQQQKDLSLRLQVEPFTEVGHIARHYNGVMDALESTFNHLDLIIKDIRDGIVTLSDAGVITSANPGAEFIFKQPAQQLIGQPLTNFFAAENNRALQQTLDGISEHLTQSQQHYAPYTEHQGVRADGEAFTMELSTTGRKHKDNNIQYTALIRDISEQRAMEAEIQHQAELSHVTLESIAEGVITCDEHQRIVYINPTACRLTEHTSEQAIGKPLGAVIQLLSTQRRPISIETLITENEKQQSIYDCDYFLDTQAEDPKVIRCNWGKLNTIDDEHMGWVIAIRDVTQRRKLQQQLKIQASYDELTTLFNRREFDKQLAFYCDKAKREHVRHLLFYLDLDRFKLVNDTCGHHAGDELLKQVAVLIRQQIRQQDIIARLGGDEFGILLAYCDLAKGKQIAEKIITAVSRLRFSWQGKTFSVGISIGIICIDAQNSEDKDLLGMADTACYAAKDQGRNRFHLYETTDSELNQRRDEIQWAARIQQAIDEDRFELFYQSIVPCSPREQHNHYEILIRMRGNEGELIPPGAFIPAAERYALMTKIDMWVIRHTLSWLGDQQAKGYHHCCSINLSGTTVGDEDCLALIEKCLEEYQIKPYTVCFEITETAAMANFDRAIDFFENLRCLNCLLALDDFGSGLSSFGYLRNLPVDYLKIDGLFIRDLKNNDVDKAIVESIHNIAHEMHLKTIAEFVENQESVDILQEIGVDFLQGYHIDKPAPLAQLTDMQAIAQQG